ncbi:MFS transporter [Streptosporangium sp. G11]|uniref:MFS transporter n=1 Tax=Streptosporangium sp. G11 TaxID=3436926 RepID=UPI003EBF81AC
MISSGPPRRRSASFLTGALSQQLGMCVPTGMIGFVFMLSLGTWYHQTGLIQAAALLSPLLLALPLGVLVDRRRRGSVLVATGLVSALSLVSLAVAFWLRVTGTVYIAVVMAVLATAWAAGEMARDAHMPSVVGRERLVPVNAALFCVVSIGSLSAPLMLGDDSGIVVPVVLVAMAVASAASALLFRGVDPPEEPVEPAEPGTGWWREAVAGVRFTLTQPVLRAMTVYLVGSALMEPLIDGVGGRRPRGEGDHEGLLVALSVVIYAAPVAGALAAVLLHRRVGTFRLAWLAVPVTQPFALLLALTGTAGGPLWYLLGEFVPRAGWAVTVVALLSHRQVITPGRLLGRTAATLVLFTGLAATAGEFLKLPLIYLTNVFLSEAGFPERLPVLALGTFGVLAAAIPLMRAGRLAGPAFPVTAPPAVSPRED